MILYSIVLFFYLVLTLTRLLPEQIGDRKRKVIYFIVFLPVFLLIAFRANTVGSDTYSYSYLYVKYGSQSLSTSLNASTWLEPGYVICNHIFYHMGFNYYEFQIFTSLFYFISFYVFLSKYTSNPALSCFLIVSRQGMFGMMNQTRMWIAICILLFAVDSLINKKTLKFVLITLLAATFHKSALCIILLYVMVRKKRNKNLFRFAYISVCGLICLLGNDFFEWLTSLLGLYENYNVIQGNIKLASIVSLVGYLLFLLALILAKSRSQEQFKNHEISVDVIICTIGLSIIGLRSVVMGRIISYFTVYLYGFVPSEIDKIDDPMNRRIIVSMILIMFTVLFFAIMILRPNWDRVIPYAMMPLNELK